MKKLILPVLAVALILPALPGTAQLPTGTPTPIATPAATASPTATATPAAGVSATPTAAADLAQATPSQIFAARTATRGIALTIGGQGLQAGLTTTRIASDTTPDCAGVACATAAGAAEPLGTTVSAQSPGEGNPAPASAGDLTPFEGALAGQFGAATAMTTPTPSAEGDADGVSIDVTLNQSILGALPPELTGGLNDAIGQIAAGLQPLADGDPTGTIGGVTDTLTGLIGDLTNSPLLTLQGGESSSSSSFEDGIASTGAASEGVIIVLLPTPESSPLLPEGLAVIEVGSSSAAAAASGTGPAVGEAQGSIARITLLPGILDALPDVDGLSPEDLPLGAILELLPPEITDLLPEPVTGLLGGGGGGEGGATPTPTPAPTSTSTEGGGPTGTPLDEIIPASFMQADGDSGGFVINLTTGTEQMCFLEDTPLSSCVTLGGTSQTLSEDQLGIGVLAAGVDISLLRDENGVGQIELSVARSEAGAAADFVSTPVIPGPTPTPQTGMPSTGGGTTFVVPALAMMALGGTALLGLRRRREDAL